MKTFTPAMLLSVAVVVSYAATLRAADEAATPRISFGAIGAHQEYPLLRWRDRKLDAPSLGVQILVESPVVRHVVSGHVAFTSVTDADGTSYLDPDRPRQREEALYHIAFNPMANGVFDPVWDGRISKPIVGLNRPPLDVARIEGVVHLNEAVRYERVAVDVANDRWQRLTGDIEIMVTAERRPGAWALRYKLRSPTGATLKPRGEAPCLWGGMRVMPGGRVDGDRAYLAAGTTEGELGEQATFSPPMFFVFVIATEVKAHRIPFVIEPRHGRAVAPDPPGELEPPGDDSGLVKVDEMSWTYLAHGDHPGPLSSIEIRGQFVSNDPRFAAVASPVIERFVDSTGRSFVPRPFAIPHRYIDVDGWIKGRQTQRGFSRELPGFDRLPRDVARVVGHLPVLRPGKTRTIEIPRLEVGAEFIVSEARKLVGRVAAVGDRNGEQGVTLEVHSPVPLPRDVDGAPMLIAFDLLNADGEALQPNSGIHSHSSRERDGSIRYTYIRSIPRDRPHDVARARLMWADATVADKVPFDIDVTADPAANKP